ncbi:MAG: hypothetical protein IJG85_05085 [Eubacteriaceae bacterium]|nr:hypothetical protein [Eubacteriaceae bacterium]
MRNVEKTIEQGKKLISENPETGLIVSELQQFYDDFQTDKIQSEGNAVFNLMGKVFYFGVAQGYRIAKKKPKK